MSTATATLPAHLAQFLRPLRAPAPVVTPRDRAPVFEPSQGGSAPRRAQLPDMPELEAHDMALCDNNTDELSFQCDI